MSECSRCPPHPTPPPPTPTPQTNISALLLVYKCQLVRVRAGGAKAESGFPGCGGGDHQILTMARSRQEAEHALATADVNPIMVDEKKHTRRLRRMKEKEAADPAPLENLPSVKDQLDALLDQVERPAICYEFRHSALTIPPFSALSSTQRQLDPQRGLPRAAHNTLCPGPGGVAFFDSTALTPPDPLQAVGQALLTQKAKGKITQKVESGLLNPTTCMLQWSRKIEEANLLPASRAESGFMQEQDGRAAARVQKAEWRAVVDKQSGDTCGGHCLSAARPLPSSSSSSSSSSNTVPHLCATLLRQVLLQPSHPRDNLDLSTRARAAHGRRGRLVQRRQHRGGRGVRAVEVRAAGGRPFDGLFCTRPRGPEAVLLLRRQQVLTRLSTAFPGRVCCLKQEAFLLSATAARRTRGRTPAPAPAAGASSSSPCRWSASSASGAETLPPPCCCAAAV